MSRIFYKYWLGTPGKFFFKKIFLPSCRAPQNAPNKRARFFLKRLFLKIWAKETQKTVKMTPTFEKINFLTPLKNFFWKKRHATLSVFSPSSDCKKNFKN